MKITFIIIALLSATMIWLSSCGENSEKNTLALSVLIDKTDQLTLAPEQERLYQLFHLDKKSKTEVVQGVNLRISEISGVDFNRASEVSIPAVRLGEINIKARQKEVVAFYEKADKAFETGKASATQKNSSIFLPVVREANRLTNITADSKLLIIYSDLVENSDWMNSYTEYDAPEELLEAKFKAQTKIENLSGIKIVLRYIPRSGEDNRRYRKLSAVYKKLFESKGATVSFEF